LKKNIALAALTGALMGSTSLAAAQDAYVIGVSAAMTGPAAATYAPVVESMKAYLEHVNAKGGIRGKPVKLVVLDDRRSRRARQPTPSGCSPKTRSCC